MDHPSGWRRSPFADGEQRFLAGRLGVQLFIASLAMLFGGSVIGFLVIRLSATSWPESMPPLPGWLWLSTLVLLGTSGTMHLAVIRERAGRRTASTLAVLATIALATAFLGVQALSWWIWRGELRTQLPDGDTQRFALSAFYVLTGVHAAHVIGGMVPLLMLLSSQLRRGGRPPSRGRIRFCAMYWHFLDVVWIVLFAVLLVGV